MGHEFNGFMDSDDSFESEESLEYGRSDSIDSGESDSTRMLPIPPPEEMIPIFPTEEDQQMRFRYALSQILLPPPVEEEEVEGSSKLKLPPAVQEERASMLLEGETSFQPYGDLDEEDELEGGEDFEKLEDLDELEDLDGSVDELPELAALEKYRGPNWTWRTRKILRIMKTIKRRKMKMKIPGRLSKTNGSLKMMEMKRKKKKVKEMRESGRRKRRRMMQRKNRTKMRRTKMRKKRRRRRMSWIKMGRRNGCLNCLLE